MIKQVLLLALGTVALSQLGNAAACGTGSLASYIALGSSGCTIGGDTLYNFQLLTGSGGATPIGTGLVTITPSGSTFAPAITLSTTLTATTNSLESIFSYDITGASFTSISAVLGGSSEASASGGVTGLVNVCEGGNLGPTLTSCTTTMDALTTVDGFQNMDMSTIGKATFLNVADDFEIDGPASGGTLTNSFTAVPEPLSSSLTSLGLILVATLKIRAIRTAKESK